MMTDIVHIPRVQDSSTNTPPAEETTMTVFGQFVSILAARYVQQEHSTLSGAGRLIGFPFQAILLGGLWVIMQKIAELISRPLTTETAVTSVAERTDRLISGGIVLTYGSPEAAAEAFHADVVTVTTRSHNNGPIFQIGQHASAKFFAKIVKAARDYRRELKNLAETIAANNVVRGFEGYSIGYTNTTPLHDLLMQMIHCFDEKLGGTATIPPSIFQRIEDEKDHVLLAQSTLRLFHCNPTQWTTRANVNMETEWLNTQILLALVNGDQTLEHLTVNQYIQALKTLGDMSDEAATAHVRAHLSRRQVQTLTAGQEKWLNRSIARLISGMLRHRHAGYDDSISMDVFVDTLAGDHLLPTDQALRVAAGDHHMFGGDTNEEWLRSHVLSAIVWNNLTIAEFDSIMGADTLSTSMIVEGCVEMDETIRSAAVKHLIESPRGNELTEQDWILLSQHSLPEMSYSLIAAKLESLPAAVLDRALPYLLGMSQSKHNEKETQPKELMWHVLGRVSPKVAQEAIDRVAWREVFYSATLETLLSNENPPSPELYDRIRANVGEKRYRHLLLGTEAVQRAHEYRSVVEDNEPFDIAPWRNMYAGGERKAYTPLRAFGPKFSEADAQQMLAQITEEKAYKWARAASPNVDGEWKDVVRLRKQASR